MIAPGRLPSGLFFGLQALYTLTLMNANSSRQRDRRSSFQDKVSDSASQAESAISMMVESLVHMVQNARNGSASSFDERI